MKERNTLAGNAIIKHLQRKVLLNIKGHYMKESSTFACIVTNNIHSRQISKDTKEIYMQVILFQFDKNFVREINSKQAGAEL